MIHQRIGGRDTRKSIPLKNWETRSSLRAAENSQVIPCDVNNEEFDPFSRQLFPLSTNPTVRSRGPKVIRRLLSYRLLEYLEFTSVLETDAVIPACTAIARNRSEYRLSRLLELDILKITADESYHALCAEMLLDRIAGIVGEERPALQRPTFLQLYDREMKELDGRQRHLSQIFFVIVSETLITGTLVRLPTDPAVIPAVREVVRSHAIDEALHHAYFARVLHEYWERMSNADRDFVGPRIAKYILAFLQPDVTNIRGWLSSCAFEDAEIDSLIAESVLGVHQVAATKASAKSTIQHLESCGALEHNGTSDGLHKAELL